MPLPQILPDPERPVLIAGPTASGKSALALRIAQAQERVVVNADALQVHDSWRVLTACPTPEDEALAPHHLYRHVARGQDYSVGHWLREVAALLLDHPAPVIVGGTGLYFRALTEGLAEIPPTPPAIRAEADARIRDLGPASLLRDIDPETAARIDRLNPMRVQRAWEVQHATGRGLAAWQDETGTPLLPLERTTAFVMLPDRDWLGDRIDRRFAQMLEAGALDEARTALPYWPANPEAHLWTKAIGAPELIAHLRGQISLEEARDAATLATRQFAKRQRTWFRNRMKAWEPVPLP
jgi:tRNA dimethylallyltransferase